MQNENKNNPKVVIFASRSGSNAEKIVGEFQKRNLPVEFYGASNRLPGKTPFYDKMKDLGVDAEYIPSPKDGIEPILNFLQNIKPNLVIMAGYMCRMPKEVVTKYMVLNIHPSILPFKYQGSEDAYKDAIDNSDGITGCTVQKADEKYDTGPLIAQIGFVIPKQIVKAKDLDGLRSIGLAHEHALYPAVTYNILFERGGVLNMQDAADGALANMHGRALPIADTIIPKDGKSLFAGLTRKDYVYAVGKGVRIK